MHSRFLRVEMLEAEKKRSFWNSSFIYSMDSWTITIGIVVLLPLGRWRHCWWSISWTKIATCTVWLGRYGWLVELTCCFSEVRWAIIGQELGSKNPLAQNCWPLAIANHECAITTSSRVVSGLLAASFKWLWSRSPPPGGLLKSINSCTLLELNQTKLGPMLEKPDSEILKYFFIVGHGHLQPAGAGWSWCHALQYHTYLIS